MLITARNSRIGVTRDTLAPSRGLKYPASLPGGDSRRITARSAARNAVARAARERRPVPPPVGRRPKADAGSPAPDREGPATRRFHEAPRRITATSAKRG